MSAATAEITAPRLLQKYRDEVLPALMKEFSYKNTMQAGDPYTIQPLGELFADEIRLAIPVDQDNPCLLVSWEVGFKGSGGVGPVQAQLHSFLDNADPENGGRIEGTRVTDLISGSALTILRVR